MSHTPEPWYAEWSTRQGEKEHEYKGWHVFSDHTDEPVICEIPDCERLIGSRKDNARLIAASPIGYEIAKQIILACDRNSGREISDVTRREIEPLRLLAVQFMSIANPKE